MPASLKQIQVLNELSQLLNAFLPGRAHPYADQTLSFEYTATSTGVGQFWIGGSKQTAISQMLRQTLDHHPERFCPLILEIVRRGIVYRQSKSPLTRSEVEALNQLMKEVGFKIPELWDAQFLSSLTGILVPNPNYCFPRKLNTKNS